MISVFMVDTVGEHRGMHYYNFPLTMEMEKLGVQVTLLSTQETAHHPMRPTSLPVLTGFRGIYGPVPKPIRGFKYATSLLSIIRLIRRQKPSIVHFHFPQIPILDYFFFKILGIMSIKSVLTVHDVMPFAYGENISAARNSTLHNIYKNVSGLVLNSRHSMQKLAELDCSLLNKAVFIQQGASPEFFYNKKTFAAEAKSLLQLKPDIPVILVFGTIKPNKRLDLIIDAVAQIIKKQPNLCLLIGGQTQNRKVDADIKLAQSMGISKNVIWRLGKATDEQVSTFFSAADIVVFPYEWIYQSATLLLAMSLGKAIVATDVGSNRETIINGKTGLLVSTDDARSTAVALQALLENPDYAEQLGKAAQKDVEERFNWKSIAQETKDFYQRLLFSEVSDKKSDWQATGVMAFTHKKLKK